MSLLSYLSLIYATPPRPLYIFKYLEILHIIYIVTRVLGSVYYDKSLMIVATNVLIIACIISWIRLTAIFPVNSTLVTCFDIRFLFLLLTIGRVPFTLFLSSSSETALCGYSFS